METSRTDWLTVLLILALNGEVSARFDKDKQSKPIRYFKDEASEKNFWKDSRTEQT
jgi:hypothetical protein